MDELKGYLAEGKPVLVDFFQFNCNPCRIMEGVVDEIAEEFDGVAHVLKVNVGRVPGAIEMFGVRSTPTFVLLAPPPKRSSKKARRTGAGPARSGHSMNPRWRASGLVKKDVLTGVLRSNGAGGDGR